MNHWKVSQLIRKFVLFWHYWTSIKASPLGQCWHELYREVLPLLPEEASCWWVSLILLLFYGCLLHVGWSYLHWGHSATLGWADALKLTASTEGTAKGVVVVAGHSGLEGSTKVATSAPNCPGLWPPASLCVYMLFEPNWMRLVRFRPPYLGWMG